ncbi:MAG: DUF6605 domain-containing protein [Acidimicrobiales bacterium]
MAFETITGYCWPQSGHAGDAISLHLSSAGGRPATIEVARVGGERAIVYSTSAVPVEDHPTPPNAATDGCDWPAAHRVVIDPSWLSGYYEVVLSIDVDGKTRRSYAFFVVRPKPGQQTASVLIALGTNTWHAYNDFGGDNLYTGATQVSLQRPMAPGYLHKPPGAGRRVTSLYPDDRQSASHVGYLRMNHLSPWGGSAGWPNWELPFVQWVEQQGYALDYCTNADLKTTRRCSSTTVFPPTRSTFQLVTTNIGRVQWGPVEDFIAAGGNAAFLSGNTAFWQVRHEDPTPEGPAKTMVGYKGQFKNDPVFGTDKVRSLTSIWSDYLIERPENHMTGVSFSRGGYHRIGKRVTNGAGGYTMHRTDHWLFDGTGLDYGDVLGGPARVVGYECDGCVFTYVDGLPVPTGEDGTPANFVILGTAPAAPFTRTTASRPPAPGQPGEDEFVASRLFNTRERWAVDKISHGHAVFGTYVSAGGGTVVTSGSTEWAHGLAERDEQIEQITRNLLDRLGDHNAASIGAGS